MKGRGKNESEMVHYSFFRKQAKWCLLRGKTKNNKTAGTGLEICFREKAAGLRCILTGPTVLTREKAMSRQRWGCGPQVGCGMCLQQACGELSSLSCNRVVESGQDAGDREQPARSQRDPV